MMRSIEDITADIRAAEQHLSRLLKERDEFHIAQSPHKVGDVLTFGRKREEGKVVALESRYGLGAMPIVVLKKKNGEWGERQKRLYSWELEQPR